MIKKNTKTKFYSFIRKYSDLNLTNKFMRYVADLIEEGITSKNKMLPTITIIIIPPRTFKTTFSRLLALWLRHVYPKKRLGMLSYNKAVTSDSIRMINMVDKIYNMHEPFIGNKQLDVLIYDECHMNPNELESIIKRDAKRNEFLKILNINTISNSSVFIFTSRSGNNDLVNFILNAGLGVYIKYVNIKADYLYPYLGYTRDGLYKTKRMIGEEHFNLLYNGVPRRYKSRKDDK